MPDPSVNPVDEPHPAEPLGRCTRCGYSFTGLASKECPECGFPVGGSTLLRFADPAWLRTLVLASRLMRGGAIVALCVHFAPDAIAGMLRGPLGSLGTPSKVAMRGVEFAALAVAVAGAWLLASPDPMMDDAADSKSARRRLVFRTGLVCVFALASARAALGPWLPPLAMVSLSGAACGLGFYLLRGLGDVVRQLTSRCSEPDLAAAKAAGGGGWLAVVIAGFIAVSAFPLIQAVRGFSGAGMLTAAAKAAVSGERVLLWLALMGAGFTLLSLAKPMRAVRSEFYAAKSMGFPGDRSRAASGAA